MQSNVLLLTTEHVTSNEKHIQQTVLCQNTQKPNATGDNSLVRKFIWMCSYLYTATVHFTDSHHSSNVDRRKEGYLLNKNWHSNRIYDKVVPQESRTLVILNSSSLNNNQGRINHCAGCTMGGGPAARADQLPNFYNAVWRLNVPCMFKRNDD